jgi:hypothetical protein
MRIAATAVIAVAALGPASPHRAAAAEPPCPVTIPNRSDPPPGGGSQGPGSLATHGNGQLWTVLPDEGIWLVPASGVQPDGSIRQKFVWWRRVIERTTVVGDDGVVRVEATYAGTLLITGRRLGATSPPATATTQHEGVHVGSTITFPTGGCWEVTGSAGEDVLTFVVYMLPPGAPMPDTALPPPSVQASPLARPALVVILLVAAAVLALGRLRAVGSGPSQG